MEEVNYIISVQLFLLNNIEVVESPFEFESRGHQGGFYYIFNIKDKKYFQGMLYIQVNKALGPEKINKIMLETSELFNKTK